MNQVVRKPVYGDFFHVRYKPGCIATINDQGLGISDLESREIELFDSTSYLPNQLCDYRVFAYAKSRISHAMAHKCFSPQLMECIELT